MRPLTSRRVLPFALCAVFPATVMLAACGGSSLKCGEGTSRVENVCVSGLGPGGGAGGGGGTHLTCGAGTVKSGTECVPEGQNTGGGAGHLGLAGAALSAG